MLRVTIDSGSGEVDYTKYVTDQSINIQRSLNTPSTCTISLNNLDSTFQIPPPTAYIRIFSTKYNRLLFTGFLVNAPNFNYLSAQTWASQPPTNPPSPTPPQLFQYDFTFTSDEYLLQIKSIAFIPAFVNQTQGQILTTIANTLCPGYFNTEFVASGQLVPYLLYDPTTSWSEYAKQFGDASNYRYSCVNKEIHFQPYGDGNLGIAYDETAGQGTFDPTMLVSQSMTNPIVNDITVVGSQEAGNNHEDYFMGDGFTGTFPLRHQVYNAGATQGTNQGNSGSVLLADAWSETSFNTQMWNVFDPTSAYTLVDNALNVITDLSLTYGESYITSYNGIELAGGIIMQHGEFTFNASSTGIVGGVFDDTTLNPETCETGYLITPTPVVVVTASGASGISIQPYRLGAVPYQGFQVVTEINHTYVLTTITSAPSPVRYTQIYTTIGGSVFGGEALSASVQGNITWQVQDTNIFTGVINTYTFAVSGVSFPSYAVYALVNNVHLNCSIQSTSIYTPPQGTLNLCSEIGAGLLVPVYISGNQQYTGAYVTPSGGNLPILPGELGPEQQWPLGSSLQNQTAEIDLGTTVSSLNFYSNDLPGVGTRIRLQTWESQAAVARVVDATSVLSQAAIVGDDGHRSTIVTNLNPLPRTSEDCEAACQAYITDRVGSFFQGTYTASWLFFNQQTNDIDFYPTCGRYLYCNAPARGLYQQQFLVSSITTRVTEMRGEKMDHVISYGPDYHLEKILANFIEQPPNVLLPQDTVIQPLPQLLAQVGAYYLPDVQSSKFATQLITGSTCTLVLNDPMPELGAYYELRSADLNWGQGGNYLLGQFQGNQSVVLPRSGFEQLWYLRFIYNSPQGIQSISRRSKVLRVYWPEVPSVPAYLYADSTTINCDFNGDIRNIEGIELRDDTGTNVYYDGIVGSEFDMMLNLNSLRGSISANASVIGGPVGSYMKGTIPIGGIPVTKLVTPTTVTQLSEGQTAWWTGQPLTNALATGNAVYAVAESNGPSALVTIYNPLQFGGMTVDIPGNATIQALRVLINTGVALGNLQTSTVTVQLTVEGYPVGPAITHPALQWMDPQTFGTGGQSPDSVPDWNAVVTPEQLNSGLVGCLVSVVTSPNVPGGSQQQILLMNGVQFEVIYIAPAQRNFNVYFFNLMWEYSPPLAVYIPPPPQAQISIGYRWGASLQINVGAIARTDILYTTLQLASASSAFLTSQAPSGSFNNAGQPGLWYQGQTNGNPASFQVNVPVTGGIFAQVQFQDYIGAGAWSEILYIPQGNLIASDYLGAQGSVPPTITNGNLGSGGLFAYFSQNNGTGGAPTISLSSSAFQVIYPNGHVDNVAALYQTFTTTVDNNGAGLTASTTYGFFPAIDNPLSSDPVINFNGPYLNYQGTLTALLQQFADGTVPLTNGPFLTATPAAGVGNTTGGGGGGTGGGGNCAAVERWIELNNGRRIQLHALRPGDIVKTPSGKGAKVIKLERFADHTARLLFSSGVSIRCGYGHTLKVNGEWRCLADFIDDEDPIRVWTERSDKDKLIWISHQGVLAEICRIHLDGDEHIYNVDGIWAHNTLIKNGS